MKHDVNNIDYEIIHEICAFNSQCTCTLKKEAPQSEETKQRNVFKKKRSEVTKSAYSYQ